MYGYYGNTFNQQVAPRPVYMPQQQFPDIEQASPFNIVKFVNETEAQGFVLLPNQKALLMDTSNMKFWIKWTDSLGNSSIETYKFEKTDNNGTAKDKPLAIDTSKFLTEDSLKNVATKEELDGLREIIDRLEKQVKISQIMNEKSNSIQKGE